MSEFKVGDKVLVCDHFFGDNLYTIREIKHKEGFVSIALFVESGFFRLSGIRHATPEEIAAGHRIDKVETKSSIAIPYEDMLAFVQMENDMGDDFPIENRISPLCKSKDV